MANVRGKQVDTTYLSIEQAEQRGFIHRDYIAHCLRWTHVMKFLGQKHRYVNARILDIGCGKEAPLAKTMYTSKMSPVDGYYIGVDYGKIPNQEIHDKMGAKFYFELLENINSATDIKSFGTKMGISKNFSVEHKEFSKPNVITCFEVLEHMEPELVVKTLKNIKDVLADDGTVFITTPCYNGSAAANHVNEMSYQGLKWLLTEVFDFELKAEYGTFASQSDYKSQLEASGNIDLFNSLCEYYDSNLVSIIFAPLFPAHSRNTMFVLGKGTGLDQDKIKAAINIADSMMKSSSAMNLAPALCSLLN